MESGASAKVTHDIVVDKQIAFKAGEILVVEAVSPNEQRPEYKYVVTSSTLGKKYELSDADLLEVQQPGAASNPAPAAGEEVQVRDEHESVVLSHTEIAQGTCPQCGAKVANDVVECPACGSHLQSASTPKPDLGVIRRDIVSGGAIAFHKDEIVKIESEVPDEQHPEQRFLVASESLGKKFRLTDEDIYYTESQPHADLKQAEEDLEAMIDRGVLSPEEYEQARDTLLKKLSEEK